MKRYLLPPDTQYKTNLHCHSTRSDGSLSPARLKELYRAHGYSAVAFTDHDGLFYQYELTDAEFIALAIIVLEVAYLVGGGADGAMAENLKGSFFSLDKIYLNNPLSAIFRI